MKDDRADKNDTLVLHWGELSQSSSKLITRTFQLEESNKLPRGTIRSSYVTQVSCKTVFADPKTEKISSDG